MPMNECVYCDIEYEDIAEHHFEEHPFERWNPSWYDWEVDWPVERTIYVHDEHADREVREELYDTPHEALQIGYEVELKVRYYEDGMSEIIGVDGKDVIDDD